MKMQIINFSFDPAQILEIRIKSEFITIPENKFKESLST